MADAMDLVQQRVQADLQRHLHKALAKPAVATREFCVTCLAPIPAARQTGWVMGLHQTRVERRCLVNQ